jgi:hypothetical protein
VASLTAIVQRIGIVLVTTSALMSLVIHVATFVSVSLPFSMILPVAFFFCGGLCLYRRRFSIASRASITFNYSLNGLTVILIAYAAIVFCLVYRATYGSTSVGIVNGAYVVKNQDQVIRAISAAEYQRFPLLWPRAMSAWFLSMAILALKSFGDRAPQRAS